MAEEYSYSDSGYDDFMSRSIEGATAANLDQSTSGGGSSRQLNFDAAQVSGSLGDILKVGNVLINGQRGRITIEDDSGNTVAIFGELEE